MVPHIKPKGRPKHSGKLWPFKKKQSKKRDCDEKENKNAISVPAAKKVRLYSDIHGSCAYRSMILRERLRESQRQALSKVNNDEVIIDITASKNDNSPTQDKAVVEVAGIQLYEPDIACLHSSCLNDSIINIGQALIKDEFPSIGGFQSVIHSKTLTFKPEKEFVQVLNSDNAHWVCATNIGCKKNVVNVYDSWRIGDVTMDTKEAISNLLQSSSKRIYLLFPEVQQQRDGSSCGYCLSFCSYIS